ncbi:thioesterase domain-containing protein [Asanoa ferruginea]|uniref:Thioesterase domain-containing protein n=1 Tax=Asanoa ferruginea TaxID=53367 RepID=A0A3D9ZRX5_9ACTN|nr:thioesterase domain-containing protein [Asanoa ferruginea]REF99374.1 thioesterase domain-containing protein [Asanoa ferruginea]GIF45978.1 hypothetical protein Afe04nite_05170 [Asanoa ferruginea]
MEMMSVTTPQERLGGIWEALLEAEVQPDDDFFDLGGDSLLVVELVTRARQAGLQIKVGDVFDNPVLRDLAAAVGLPGAEDQQARPVAPRALSTEQVWTSYLSPWSGQAPPCLVPFREQGDGDPLFVLPSGAGNIRFITEASAWGAGRPVYGFEAPGYRGEVRPLASVPDYADRYLPELVARQPQGPYRLAGLCLGGVIALEMARRLRQRGQEVAFVALVNAPSMDPFIDRGWGIDEIFDYRLRTVQERFGMSEGDDVEKFFDVMLEQRWIEPDMAPADFLRLQMLWSFLAFAQTQHELRPYDGRVIMFEDPAAADAVARNWQPLLPNLETHWISGGTDYLAAIAANPVVAQTLRDEMGA